VAPLGTRRRPRLIGRASGAPVSAGVSVWGSRDAARASGSARAEWAFRGLGSGGGGGSLGVAFDAANDPLSSCNDVVALAARGCNASGYREEPTADPTIDGDVVSGASPVPEADSPPPLPAAGEMLAGACILRRGRRPQQERSRC
jgi:hypothetical protein